MIWLQQALRLEPRPRGFHLITGELIDAIDGIGDVSVGMLSLTIQHTSASLALNENASPAVRHDLETWFNSAVSEDRRDWTHTLEGPDDMPAHVKAVLIGPTLTLPVRRGRPWLGTWQGIYLCEHRDRGGVRRVVATVWGQGEGS
jgi:secondary thiamine-phosphate synthase enzyme